MIVATMFVAMNLSAQAPSLAGQVGNGHVYGFSSLKFHPGINAQEGYIQLQYGIGQCFSAGADVYASGSGLSSMSALARFAVPLNSYASLGLQLSPTFSLNDNMKFTSVTTALYLNGIFSKRSNMMWCINTRWGVNQKSEYTLNQWSYLGYRIPLRNGHAITPMLGGWHSWKFDQDMDFTTGFLYSAKRCGIYFYINEYLKDHIGVLMGLDFVI